MANQISDISPKFKDIISKSTLIHQEPPARYQLKPKKESLDGERQEESRLRRWTFGEKNHNKVNKTILLVGETGGGKSAMINALVNYVLGVEMDDKVWFEIVEEEKKSQSESQTSAVTVYEIFGFEDGRVPFSLTIVDTPGYGDTNGIREDAIIAERLNDLFRSEDGIREINAVAFLVKHGTNRVDDKMKYVTDAVMSLFGKDMKDKCVILITHSNRLPPTDTLKALTDADIKCARDKEEAVHFMFDNCQSTAITDTNRMALKFAWGTSEKGMKEFSNILSKAEPQTLKETMAVFKERTRLRACIDNLEERIKFVDEKQKTIQHTQKALKSHKQEIQKNKELKFEVDECYKERVTITADFWNLWRSKAVCCLECEENCHFIFCLFAEDPSKCFVMTNKEGVLRCSSCTKKCASNKHVKENWKYETKTRKVARTYTEIQSKYDPRHQDIDQKVKDVIKETETTEKKAEEIKRVLTGLQAELEDLKKEQATFVEEAYQHVVRLEEIALNTSSLSVQVHLDLLIRKMKETGDKLKVLKLKEIKKLSGQATEQAMKYLTLAGRKDNEGL